MKKLLVVLLSISVVMMGFSVLSVAEEEWSEVGNWRVMEEEDRLTDELKLVFGLFSEESIESNAEIKRLLSIRLLPNQGTDLLITAMGEVLSTGDIAYRFDDGEVKEMEWMLGSDREIIVFPRDQKDLESFVKKLITKDEFIVGFYFEEKTRQTDVFDLDGLGKAILPYLEELGWDDLEEAIRFEFDRGAGEITGYVTEGGSGVDIPSRIDGVDVKVIGNRAFYDNDLTSVVIGDGVKVIGNEAFNDNNLTSVEIPDSVVEIREEAFKSNNLTSVEIPKGVEVIGEKSFYQNDLTSVEIPNSVVEIGVSAFKHNNLTSIELGDGVEEIRDKAFDFNFDLSSIVIPDSVEVIGERAFYMSDLTSVKIGGGVDIASNSFEGNFKEVYEKHNKAEGVYVRDDTESDWYKKE